MTDTRDDRRTDDERERDEVLKVMLRTPPKPHKPKGGEAGPKEDDEAE